MSSDKWHPLAPRFCSCGNISDPLPPTKEAQCFECFQKNPVVDDSPYKEEPLDSWGRSVEQQKEDDANPCRCSMTQSAVYKYIDENNCCGYCGFWVPNYDDDECDCTSCNRKERTSYCDECHYHFDLICSTDVGRRICYHCAWHASPSGTTDLKKCPSCETVDIIADKNFCEKCFYEIYDKDDIRKMDLALRRQ